MRYDVACCSSTSRGISAMLMPRSKATSAQCRRHVQRQPGAVALGLAVVDDGALAYPGFGLRIGQRACTDTDALASHYDRLSNSSTRLLTSRAAALSGVSSRAKRPAATLSAKTMRWRTSACSAGSGWSAKAPRASRADNRGADAAVDGKHRGQRGPEHLRLADHFDHLRAGPQAVGTLLHWRHSIRRQQRGAGSGPSMITS